MADSLDLNASQLKRLRRVRTLTRLLDQAFRIPGTPVRFGLDGIIGLVPGLGDALTAALSAYMVREAAYMGVPRAVIVRMIGNIGIDMLAGAIPVVGDLVDVAFKANVKNLSLLEEYLERQQRIHTVTPAPHSPFVRSGKALR